MSRESKIGLTILVASLSVKRPVILAAVVPLPTERWQVTRDNGFVRHYYNARDHKY